MKKVYVFIGNFGSGKTEIAINFALNSAKNGKTLLIDLDLVNTYFRLTDRKEMIENAGIKLISPRFAGMNVETLALPPEVNSAFCGDWDTVIFDVGGDSAGSLALGRFKANFDKFLPEQIEILNVVNTRRPMAGTAEKLLSLLEDMSSTSRLSVTGFINNTNLATETGFDDLVDGYEVLKEASKISGIPVAYTCGKKEFLDAFLDKKLDSEYIGKAVEIETFTHRDWDSFTKKGR